MERSDSQQSVPSAASLKCTEADFGESSEAADGEFQPETQWLPATRKPLPILSDDIWSHIFQSIPPSQLFSTICFRCL